MSLRNRLRKDLLDPEFRHAYADEHLNLSVATQIKVIREQQKLSQNELAKKLNTKQAGVSRLESANYNNWSVRLLKKFAEAFDVRLQISFEEFGTLWQEVDDFSRESLQRKSFSEDPEFHEVTASQRHVTNQHHAISENPLSSVTNILRQTTVTEQGVASIDQSPKWVGRKPARSALEGWAGNGTNSMKGSACV